LTYPTFEQGEIYVDRSIRMAEELIIFYLFFGVVGKGALGIEDEDHFVQELYSVPMHVFDIQVHRKSHLRFERSTKVFIQVF